MEDRAQWEVKLLRLRDQLVRLHDVASCLCSVVNLCTGVLRLLRRLYQGYWQPEQMGLA